MGCGFWNQLVSSITRGESVLIGMLRTPDFPDEKRPVGLATNQRLIDAEQFVPQQNQFGGVVYVGVPWPLPQLIGRLAH